MTSNVELKRISLDELYESIDYKVDLLKVSPEVLDNITITEFHNKIVPMSPRCLCGSVVGGSYIGDTCFHCNTKVTQFLGTHKPTVWITANDSKKFIAPQYWVMLNDIIKQSKFDSMAWLTNVRYKSNLEIPNILLAMVNDIPGFTRKYSWVINNLRLILNYLLNSQQLYSKRDRIRVLIQLLETSPETILSSHIPLPNKSLFLIEDVGFSTKKTSLATGMIKSLALNYREAVESNRDSDLMLSRLMTELSAVYVSHVNELLASKRKVIRANIFGMKVPGSFRTVMIPISGPHRYDDFIMPWTLAVMVFRPMLVGRLVLKNKLRYLDVCKQLDDALFNYDKMIHAELLGILEDAKKVTGQGIPISMNRNPSQYRGSILLLYIVGFKIDPFDFSSEYSQLLCASLNGDFDGDEHNMMVALDLSMYKELKNFEFHHSVFNSSKPFAIAKALSMPDTTTIIISSFIMDKVTNESYISPELERLIS